MAKHIKSPSTQFHYVIIEKLQSLILPIKDNANGLPAYGLYAQPNPTTVTQPALWMANHAFISATAYNKRVHAPGLKD